MLFVTVLESNSFTRAAEKIGISKSIVSKRIRRLEEHLKLQLLQRSTRKLAPTEAGRDLYQELVSLKKRLEIIQGNIHQHQVKPEGTIRIHSPISFGILKLAPIIKKFCDQYKAVKIDIFLGQQFDDLIEQRMDISIHMGKIKDSNLFARKIMTSKLVLCASPCYLEAHGYPRTPRDLEHHNCLRYHGTSIGNQWYFKEANKVIRIEAQGNFSASSANTLAAAARAGQGVTLLPSYVIDDAIKQGKLIRLLPDYSSSHIDSYALYSARDHLAPKVRVFLDYLSGALAETQGTPVD